MSKNIFKTYKFWILLLLIIAAISAAILWRSLPYKNFIKSQIIKTLESKNIKISSLKIDNVDNFGIAISDIELDGNNPIKLAKLSAQYDLQDVLSGKVKNIEADDLELNLYSKDDKILIGGLEDFLKNNKGSSGSIKIPTDNESLKNILPDNLSIKNLNISGDYNNIKLHIPLNIYSGFNPFAFLNVDSNTIRVEAHPYDVSIKDLKINSSLGEDKKWHGSLSSPDVEISGIEESELPAFALNSDFTLGEDEISANIYLSDKLNTTKADIKLIGSLNDIKSGNIIINHISFPWGGGVISSKNIKIPLSMDKPLSFSVKLKNVALADTLGKMSGDKVKGEGKISGTFPIIYNPDGTIILKEGMAEDIDTGVISVSPDLLPGNNAQLELARNILQNFHYTKLKIMVSSKGDKSLINLALEGRNPDSPEERPVKFNINLNGDIMPLIQQSIIPFNDIKTLLKQEK